MTATYIGVQSVLIKLGYSNLFPILYFIGFAPLFLIPALYYLFLSSILEHTKGKGEIVLHLLPFVFVWLLQQIEVFMGFKKLLLLIFTIQLFSYSIASMRLLKRNSTKLLASRLMLKVLNTCLLLLSVAVGIIYSLKILFSISVVDLTSVIILFLMIFVSSLGIYMTKGLKGSLFFSSGDIKKYQHSNLNQQDLNVLESDLNTLLCSDKIYLESDLNADTLAKRLNITRHQLSEFMSQRMNSTFTELINQYRVEYVKRSLLDNNKTHFSILGLAYEAGFQSQASFYRIFKKQTGLTPSQYKAEHQGF